MSDTEEEEAASSAGGVKENLSEGISESDISRTAVSTDEVTKRTDFFEESEDGMGNSLTADEDENLSGPPEPALSKVQSKEDEEISVSESVSELGEEGFSAYERSEEDGEGERESVNTDGLAVQPSLIADAIETFSEHIAPTMSSIFKPDSRMIPTLPKEKSPDLDDGSQRYFAIEEGDEELAQIPMPSIKPNKIVPKIVGPKYPLWPVKLFETEKIHKVVEGATQRFFPRNVPYHSRSVCKKLTLLTQYIQRKVYQIGYDRRKIITIVRYHQKHWHGQRAVVRWLWCLETDAMVTYVHNAEEFIVSVVVLGMYMD